VTKISARGGVHRIFTGFLQQNDFLTPNSPPKQCPPSTTWDLDAQLEVRCGPIERHRQRGAHVR